MFRFQFLQAKSNPRMEVVLRRQPSTGSSARARSTFRFRSKRDLDGTFLGVILDAETTIPFTNSGEPVTIQEQGALIAHELNHLNRVALLSAISPVEKSIGERFARFAEDTVREQLRLEPRISVEEAQMALRGEIPAFNLADETLWELGLLTGPVQRTDTGDDLDRSFSEKSEGR